MTNAISTIKFVLSRCQKSDENGFLLAAAAGDADTVIRVLKIIEVVNLMFYPFIRAVIAEVTVLASTLPPNAAIISLAVSLATDLTATVAPA